MSAKFNFEDEKWDVLTVIVLKYGQRVWKARVFTYTSKRTLRTFFTIMQQDEFGVRSHTVRRHCRSASHSLEQVSTNPLEVIR
jgi:hypothetical protein